MESKLAHLLNSPVGWLSGSAAEGGIVISTGIQLARNLTGFPYPVTGSADDLRSVRELCTEAISKTESIVNPLEIDYPSLEETDRALLLERRLISKDFLKASAESALIVENGEAVSLMINEEDHLHFQVLSPGLNLPAVWEQISAMDDRLSGQLRFAFDERLGYLTSRPSNLGTGMHASVLLHLPGLVMTKQMDQISEGTSKLGMAIRSLFGTTAKPAGNLYEITNQSTLGESEEQIIDRLASLTDQILLHEKKAREHLASQKRLELSDCVGRAYGLLRYAYRMPEEEAMNAISSLRLGVDLGMFQTVDLPAINSLFIRIQPAHLKLSSGENPDLEEERARVIRTTLKDLRKDHD